MLPYIQARANHALSDNPPEGSTHLTTHGSDWLWAVVAVYAMSFLAFAVLAITRRKNERIFHYLFTFGLLVGTIGYFAQASDLGFVPIRQRLNNDRHGNGPTRQIFYARYITWFLTWPVLIIALSLLSGVSWATTIYSVVLAWTWICSWLVGSLIASNYKWGFYVFGVVAYTLLVLNLCDTGLTSARRIDRSGSHHLGSDSSNVTPATNTSNMGVGSTDPSIPAGAGAPATTGSAGRGFGGSATRMYTPLVAWVVFLWALYPLAWGLDEGGNYLGVTSGFIFYGILDVLLFPFTALAFLYIARTVDHRALGLNYTQHGRVRGGDADWAEKGRHHQQGMDNGAHHHGPKPGVVAPGVGSGVQNGTEMPVEHSHQTTI